MQRTSKTRLISAIIIYHIIASTGAVGQNLNPCETLNFEGQFVYEASCGLWSEDDMIYRRASIFLTKGDTIDYKSGIFAFEGGIVVPKLCITHVNKSAVEHFASLNDSIHVYIEDLKTTKLVTVDGEYKRLLLSLDVMFINNEKVRIKAGGDFEERLVPFFLILNFNYISPFPD